MSAFPIPSLCPSCGAELPRAAEACPACGASTAPGAGDTLLEELPPVESAPGPVAISRVEPRWLGVPSSLLLLCVGFAALGASVGVFAAGHWPWGLVLLGVAILLIAAFGELSRRTPRSELVERSGRLVADGRSQLAVRADVWRTRAERLLHRHRAGTALGLLEDERAPVLRNLGAATWAGDAAEAERARAQLAAIDERKARIERELQERLAQTDERIRRLRIPVDQTMLVTPGGEYPPPDEGDPPQPAPVPEPYPPPDEGTPPTPAPDPGPPGR